MVNFFKIFLASSSESTYALENAINRENATEKHYLLFVKFNIMLKLKNIIVNITVKVESAS